MHRQPSNSKEIYTSIDYENDVIKQLFTCYVGFSSPLNTDDVSKVFIHRTCELGVWKPNYEIDCVPNIGCGGLWMTLNPNPPGSGNKKCYLLTRGRGHYWQELFDINSLLNFTFRPMQSQDASAERTKFQLCLRSSPSSVYKYHCEGAAAQFKTEACLNDICKSVLSGWSEWTACNVPCGQGTQSRFRIVNGESIRSNHAYDRRQCNKTCDFGDVRSVNLKIWKETYPNLVNDLDTLLNNACASKMLIHC
ncbi:hypothetical protein EB796_016581 [Bugula neritina]|uniref:Uncharacterized protein n=1 Tax=Bugula neritina TaxID=10212 RepID=A0A7J7JFK5_BUGNE|nr:hypothetical protein EB796_016581 [Bugula neritina]